MKTIALFAVLLMISSNLTASPGQAPATKSDPNRASASPTPTPTPKPLPTNYPVPADAQAEITQLAKASDTAQQRLMQAAQKLLTCDFQTAILLEAVGQFRQANTEAEAAATRVNQWIAGHRPAECPDCRLAPDASQWVRNSNK